MTTNNQRPDEPARPGEPPSASAEEAGESPLEEEDVSKVLGEFSFDELQNTIPWDFSTHLRTVYLPFRARNGELPEVARAESSELKRKYKKTLMLWNADLGARDRMDWDGFFSSLARIVKPLLTLPALGKLTDEQCEQVVLAVAECEQFKNTASRKLVFGSKSLHFLFPWLIPVVSSDVVRGIEAFRRAPGRPLDTIFKRRDAMKFGSNPDANVRAYMDFIDYGNMMLENFDCQKFLPTTFRHGFGLDAKAYEWTWVHYDRISA
jgi:hypothetical protein